MGGASPRRDSGNLSGVCPQEEELYACRRGCRLFSICQFVRDGGDLNRTKSECEASKSRRSCRGRPGLSLRTSAAARARSKCCGVSKTSCRPAACQEAYSQSEEQFACSLGCQNQLPFAEQRHEQVTPARRVQVTRPLSPAPAVRPSLCSQLEIMVPRIHLLYPLTLVRGFWDDVMSQAQSLITSTWTFYLQADDGKVVIFQVRGESRLDSVQVNVVVRAAPLLPTG